MASHRSYFSLAVASLLVITAGLPSVAEAQTISRWINSTGGAQFWNSGPNWTNLTVPNSSGDIASVVANIGANQIIDLSGTITIGTLNLGDFSSNQTYTIGVSGDTLSFDNRFWGGIFDLQTRAELNKVMGGADVIAATVDITNSDLAIYNRVSLNITGQINDGGMGRSLLKMGTSDLTLSGINGYSGDTIIYTTGGTVFLNATGGNAINSTLIRLGNSSYDGGSTVRLRLLQSDQINDSAVIRFDGASGREAFFQLNSQSETIQGISDYTGRGVIENIGGSASTLTLNTAGNDYSYNGFIRNNGAGTTALIKNDAGALNLSGGQITFTGGLTINGGTVQLSNIRVDANNQAQFGSNITNAAALELEATAEWVLRTVISGTGTVTKLGNSTLNLSNNNTYSGATSVANGTLRLTGPNGSLSSTSGITLSGRTDALAAVNTLSLTNRRAVSVSGGSTSNGSTVITVSSTADIVPGMTISGPNIPGGATVLSVGSGTQFTISAAATGSASSQTFSFGAANNTNRINNAAPITSLGGAVRFENNGDAANTYTESLGALALTSGPTAIAAGKIGSAADPAESTLTFASLARSAGATVNFANIGGPEIGSGIQNRVMFTGGLTLDDSIVGGWATVGNDWVTYDVTNGVQALPAGSYNTGAPGTWISTSNVKINAAQTLGAVNLTINSLNFQDTTARTLNMNSRELTLASGGLMASGANHTLGTNNANAGTIKVGTSAGHAPGFDELVVTVDTSRTLTVFSQFANNGATPMTVVKTGGGKLTMTPFAVNNTYSGGTIINAGSIEIKDKANLGTNQNANYLVLNGGAIEFAASSNITLDILGTRQITIGENGGRIELDFGETFTVPYSFPQDFPITGPGRLTIGGGDAVGGTLNLNGTVGMLGGLTVVTSDVYLNNTANTFGGDVTITGGNLIAINTGAIPDGLPLSMSGGSLQLVEGTVTVSSLTAPLSSGISITNLITSTVDSTLVVDQRSNTTYGGIMTNFAGARFNLTKAGTGILTLSNADSDYAGVTDIAGGAIAATSMNYAALPSPLGYGGYIGDFAQDYLFIRSGAALIYSGASPSVTDRMFTMGTGPEGAAIYANGTSVGATLEFQDWAYPGWMIGFDNSNQPATLTLGGRNTGGNIFGLPIADNGTGYVSLVKTGPGTWVLYNTPSGTLSNTYSGSTKIYEGRLIVAADNALGSKGSSGPPVELLGGVLDLRNVNYTASGADTEDLLLAGGRLETSSGNSIWAGRVDVVANLGPNISIGRDSTLTLAGPVGGGQSGILSVDKDGFGDLIMSGANTYLGTTRIRDGSLILDYSNGLANNKLSDSSALLFGQGRLGGTLVLKNTGVAVLPEVIGSTTLDRGSHEILLDNSSAPGSVTINLGNITQNAGALLDVEMGGLARTTRTNLASGILGAWATVAHTDWAFKDAPGASNGFIEPLTSYVIDTWGGALTNTDAQNNFAPPSSSITNTLRFNQPASSVTVTLSGDNVLSSGGILVTPNVTTVNRITGGTLSAGSVAAGTGSITELVVQHFSTDGPLLFETVITDRTLPTPATIGFQKLGPGMLALAADSTYTGVTTIGGGTLTVNHLANGGLPSGIGQAAGNNAANIVIGGGTLDYAGESVEINRAMTVKDFGALSVNDEDMTLTLGGSDTTANFANVVGDAGTAEWSKTGSGTLRLLRREVSGGASGIQLLDVADGKLILEYGYSTTPSTPTSPTPPHAVDRLFNSSAKLRVSGGKLELIGEDFVYDNPSDGNDGNGQSFQRFFGQFEVGAGASEIQVTSRKNEYNLLIDQTTTLGIGNATDAQAILRELSGTVLFIENPNGGVANLVLSTFAEEAAKVIPWATYWDKSNIAQPGVNNFAAIEPFDDGIVSADSKSLYVVKSNLSDWGIGGTEDISEGSTPFSGTRTVDTKIRTLRFFNDDAAGSVTINGGNTLTLTAGAILATYHTRNNVKTITGGTLTSEYLPADGQAELMIHNYNVSTPLRIESVIADPTTLVTPAALNLVHTGTGTTSLFAANTYTGRTYLTGGVLRLENANAIPGGIATAGGTSALTIDGGVLGLTSASGDFTRGLGTGIDQAQWLASGGFAAYGADMNVNIGGASAQVRWGLNGFVPDGDTLVLGSQDADKKVTFQNPIDLGIMDRLVRVENGRAGEDAQLSGVLSGLGSLTKNGEGTLRLSAVNAHTGGTTLGEGTLVGATATAFSTGPINVGTTGNTETNDALNLVLEGGSNANAFVFGNRNSAGITTLDPVGGVTLNGTIATDKQIFVAPEASTTLDLTNTVSGSGGLTLVDGGTLKLQGTNSYGTGRGVAGTAIDGSTIIRSGTVELHTNMALGDGTKAVELGDAMIAPVTVDAATTGASLIYAQGTFDPFGNGVTGSANGIGAFYNVSSTIDGITYTSADVNKLILVKDQFDNPEQNGIYKIVFDIGQPAGTMNLARVDDGVFPLEPLYKDYGQGITVTNGAINGGKNFFQAINVDGADFIDLDGPLNTDPYHFKSEQTFNPDVSLLAAVPMSSPIANDIDVNDTNGTGTTTIGGKTTLLRGTVEFSGDVTLQSQLAAVESKDLFLTATGCADILFSGVIGESAAGDLLNLIKVGTGKVTLSGANTYDGFTEVRDGLLVLNHASALGAGNLNIAGGVVGLTVASGDLTRALGTGNGQVQWTDSGGFAAYGGDANPRTVNVGAAVTWGSGGFVPTGEALMLGAGDADAKVILSSAINLGAVQRTVRVAAGPAAVEGELSGALTGAGASLNKTGQGALLLSGTNSYSGGTTLAQGTLQGSKSGVFGTGAVQLGGLDTLPGDALKLELLGDPTIGGTTNTLSNNLIIGAQNNLGTTSIDATAGSATTDAILSGTVTLNRDVFIGPDAGAVMQMGGGVSGAGRITLVDGGTLRLTGANTYGTGGGASGAAINGGTILRDGTIEINSTTALGATTIELGDASSTIDLGLGIQIDRASNMALSDCPSIIFSAGTFSGVSTTFDGTIYTAGDIGKRLLLKDEAGNPERNGIYQITALSGDTMTLTRDTAYDQTAEMIYGSTSLQIQNGSSQNKHFFLTGNVLTVNTSPVLWREATANPNVALLATSAVSGLTIANNIDLNKTNGAGTHTIGGLGTGAGALTTGTVTFSGTMTMQSQAAGAESLELVLTSATLTNNGVTVSGVLSDADPLDSLILRKTGTGVATLTGNNIYNGASSATYVDAGVLLVNNSDAVTGSGTGTGPVTVSNTGTVLGGTGRIAGNTTINADAILQPGGAVADGNGTFDSAVESLAFGGDLTLAANSKAIFQLAGNANNDQALVTGTLSVDMTTILEVVLFGYTPSIGHTFNLLDWGTLSYSGIDLADQLVLPGNPADWDTSAFHTLGVLTFVAPEPGRMVLLILGMAAAILRRRRR